MVEVSDTSAFSCGKVGGIFGAERTHVLREARGDLKAGTPVEKQTPLNH